MLQRVTEGVSVTHRLSMMNYRRLQTSIRTPSQTETTASELILRSPVASGAGSLPLGARGATITVETDELAAASVVQLPARLENSRGCNACAATPEPGRPAVAVDVTVEVNNELSSPSTVDDPKVQKKRKHPSPSVVEDLKMRRKRKQALAVKNMHVIHPCGPCRYCNIL